MSRKKLPAELRRRLHTIIRDQPARPGGAPGLLPPTAHVGTVAAAYRDRLATLAASAQCYAVSGDTIEMSNRKGKMQRADFIKAVAQKAGVGQKEAKLIVDNALEIITEALACGEKVRDRAAREGVNPQTREKIQIAGGKTAGFSASSALKEAVKDT